MNKELILQIFKAAYNRQSFIDNVLLPTVQGKVDNLEIYDDQGAQEVELTTSEEQYAKSAIKYGEFTTRDEIGRTVELYEVILHDHKQVERSRVGIAALIKKQIIGNNAVLVNFAYENPQNRSWRFSFVAHDAVFTDGEMVQSETNPKRYTYVFGEPDETYRTALDRFYTLGHEYAITVETLKDAFGVEAMSKVFFDEYRDIHYFCFVDYLSSSNFKQSAFNGSDKAIRDFVKKLLGRIVFLYFIQKKGWLGASNGEYKDGDKNFMSNFYEMAGANESFYSTWLSKLFFETLNNPRPNDAFEMPDGSTVKVPYLNGGLFEKEFNQYDYLTFPADLFTELFDFFDQYNFTIYEDSPEEHTVAVDPEMLGHIFENLLDDNKDKGAFYTPKEIVHYMTQESLIEYLHTQIPAAERDELEAFVKNKDSQLSDAHKKQVDQKLHAVKICDPAIGSGAFPMGLLQEIFGMKERIAYDLGYTVWSPATVKEHIIQNSIYGVDIEQGAVDIARLRFWLSLIVDEDMPKALPNLEYKIVVGNSLVSKFEDEIIEINWSTDSTTGGIFGQELIEEKTRLLKTISTKQKEFFTADNDAKAKLSAQIRKLKLDILAKQLELMIETKGAKRDSNALSKPSKKQAEKYLETEGWKRTLSKINQLKTNDKPFKHFDWKLDFPEILNPTAAANEGFDIVIGNPPYIKVQNLNDEDSRVYKSIYSTAKGKYDIYVLFIELAFKLVKNAGNIMFINPHRFIISEYGKALRELIKESNWLRSLLYFGVDQVFENATTYAGVFQFKKDSQNVLYSEPKNKDLSSIEFTEIPYSLLEEPWILTENENTINTLNRINQFQDLSHYCEGVYQGIISIGDKIFMLDGTVEGDIFKGYSEALETNVELESNAVRPVLKGEDIGRYKKLETRKYVIYLHKLNENKTISLEENEVEKSLPRTYEYLSNFRDYLIDKKIKYKTNPKYWYSLHRSRELSILTQEGKIITPQLQNKSSFTIDYSGKFIPDAGGYIVAPKEKSKYLSKTLLSILNSKLFYFFITKTSTPYNNNYYYFKTNYIQPFKLPKSIEEHSELFNSLAEIVLTLNRATLINPGESYTNLIKELEEVIDALVFELYFPAEFQAKGIEIEKHAKELFKPIDNLSEGQKIEQIKAVYEELRKKENPLRNQIKLMKIELKDLLLPILSV